MKSMHRINPIHIDTYKLVKEQSIYSLVKFEVLYVRKGWILVIVTEQ